MVTKTYIILIIALVTINSSVCTETDPNHQCFEKDSITTTTLATWEPKEPSKGYLATFVSVLKQAILLGKKALVKTYELSKVVMRTILAETLPYFLGDFILSGEVMCVQRGFKFSWECRYEGNEWSFLFNLMSVNDKF